MTTTETQDLLVLDLKGGNFMVLYMYVAILWGIITFKINKKLFPFPHWKLILGFLINSIIWPISMLVSAFKMSNIEMNYITLNIQKGKNVSN